MGSKNRPVEDFYLDKAADESGDDSAQSTTVDDSYLAHLSDRLAEADDTNDLGEPKTGELVATPLEIRRAADGIATAPVPTEKDRDNEPHGTLEGYPAAEEPSAEVMELSDDAIETLEPEVESPGAAGALGDPLDGPLERGPSDLLSHVPPAPDEGDLLDPALNPATYDAPTFVRPSLVDQDPVPVVEIVEGNERGRSYRVEKTEISIGRGLENDIVLTDIAVSRRHLRIKRDGDAVVLHDNGSGNGSLVNGSRAGVQPIKASDRIEIGNTIFRVVFPGESVVPLPDPGPPPPSPMGGALHNRSTAYIGDGQAVLDGVQGAGGVEVSPALTAPPVAPNRPTVSPVQETTDGVSLPRAGAAEGLPRSFKLAMGGLAAAFVLIGVVGLAAAIMHATRNRPRVTTAAQTTEAEDAAVWFAKGREAYVERQWAQAAAFFEKVIALSPENPEAVEFRRQARGEQHNEGTLEAARQAHAEKNYSAAMDTLNSIPRSSVYSTDAVGLRLEAERLESDALVIEARSLVASGDRDTALVRLGRALELRPTNADARSFQEEIARPGTETTQTDPSEATGEVQVATAPSLRAGGRSKRGGTKAAGKGAGRARSSGGRSRATAQVLVPYKRGQFGEASARARELAASAGSSRDRSKARSLAGKIDRFAKVWQSTQSGGSLRQQMSYLESALRLDRQISGGHYAAKIRPQLRDAYVKNAQRAWRAGQYASACQSAQRALKLDRGASGASDVASRCAGKARDFYEQGMRAERSDLSRAKSYWRKVLNMVPQSNTWYKQAYKSLNNAGRGRHLDEDE